MSKKRGYKLVRANGEISQIEVSPVRFYVEDGEKYATVTTPDKAQAWSVYKRVKGMAVWVSDHRTKKAAMAKAARLV